MKVSTDRERIAAAWDHLCDLCSGKARWTMTVPVNEARDSDTVIGAGLEAGERALDRVAELEAAIADLPCGCGIGAELDQAWCPRCALLPGDQETTP